MSSRIGPMPQQKMILPAESSSESSGSKKTKARVRYEKVIVWSCDKCGQQGGMTTDIESCPDCDHIRCKNCSTERIKTKEVRKTRSAAASGEFSSPNIETSVHTANPALSLTAEDFSTTPPETKLASWNSDGPEQQLNVTNPEKTKIEIGRDVNLRFACPFQKKDPWQYGFSQTRKYRACLGPGYSPLRRLKDHLKIHRLSNAEKALGTNSGKRRQKPIIVTEGISDDQWSFSENWLNTTRGVSDSQRHQEEYDKWFQMYRDLFPHAHKPEHPWNEPIYPPLEIEKLLSRCRTLLEPKFRQGGLEQGADLLETCLNDIRQAYEIETSILKNGGNFDSSPPGTHIIVNEPQQYNSFATTGNADTLGHVYDSTEVGQPLQDFVSGCIYQDTESMTGAFFSGDSSHDMQPMTELSYQPFLQFDQPQELKFSPIYDENVPILSPMNSWQSLPRNVPTTSDPSDPFIDPMNWTAQPTMLPSSLQFIHPAVTLNTPNSGQTHPPSSMHSNGVCPSQFQMQAAQTTDPLASFFGCEFDTEAMEMIPSHPSEIEPLPPPSEVDISRFFSRDHTDSDGLMTFLEFEGDSTSWMAPSKNSYDRNRCLQGGGQGIQP